MICDKKFGLEGEIDTCKRIIAYREFEDLDEQVDDAIGTAASAEKMLDKATESVGRCNARLENEKAVDIALEDLRKRFETLMEFQKRFVGDKVHDGFKMWVYRTKVLPLIEQEVNKFIGQIDSFSLLKL
jgi:hypothetical protein